MNPAPEYLMLILRSYLFARKESQQWKCSIRQHPCDQALDHMIQRRLKGLLSYAHYHPEFVVFDAHQHILQ